MENTKKKLIDFYERQVDYQKIVSDILLYGECVMRWSIENDVLKTEIITEEFQNKKTKEDELTD
jgi:hypothetical protein